MPILHRVTLPIILLLMLHEQTIHSQDAITYELNNGRFGDHLMTYIKAKWISYHYKIPLLYKPFEYSECLFMHTFEQHFKEEKNKKYTIKNIKTARELESSSTSKNTLYSANLKFQAPEISNILLLHQYILNNDDFRKELETAIEPLKNTVEPVSIPDNMITIAVHIRTGGGYMYDRPLQSEQIYSGFSQITRYDIKVLYSMYNNHKKRTPQSRSSIKKIDNLGFDYTPTDWKEIDYLFADKEHPTRFPPLQFYIDQINYLHRKFYHAPLFVHIFTDHPNPREFADLMKEHVSSNNIQFYYREHDNTHDSHVIEDLFAMMSYDCLIRPASSYSKIAQLLGKHKVIIYPKSAVWIEETKLFINEASVIFKVNFSSHLSSHVL